MEARASTAAAESGSTGLAFLKRALREPLVHFLVLGAALFAVSRWVKPADKTPTNRQIVMTLDDLRQLQIGFAA